MPLADLALTPGTYTIQIRALGSDGNSPLVNFPSLTIIAPPEANQVCADYTTATPRADWLVNLGSVDSIRVKIDGVEMIQGGPTATSAPLPTLGAGNHTIRVEALRGGAVPPNIEVSFTLPSSARICSATPPRSNVFTVDRANNRILDPSGTPIKLRGYRVLQAEAIQPVSVSNRDPLNFRPADIAPYVTDGTAGNCQAVELWFSAARTDFPSDPNPRSVPRPGDYNTARIATLKKTIRNLKDAGIWTVPSLRVSYEYTKANQATNNGTPEPLGWARHRDVLMGLDVRGGGTLGSGAAYTAGNARDRFFAWIEWLIDQLTTGADSVADCIAYWEMWHYFGHHQEGNIGNAQITEYLDSFIPEMIGVYRNKLPSALLGVGLVLDGTVGQLINRVSLATPTWRPYEDRNGLNAGNLVYIVAGYGFHNTIFRADAAQKTFPTDSNNPMWMPTARPSLSGYTGNFNIVQLQELCAQKFGGLAWHEQEGPGLINWWRRNPVPTMQRNWVKGMLNFYNDRTNGFAFHAWPPSWGHRDGGKDSWIKPPTGYNETDILNMLRQAMAGTTIT